MLGHCGNIRVGVESEHAAVAPGCFLEMKEEAALCILNSAGEGGRRHFRGLFAPGTIEVLVQDG